jgi:hypothetical protein
MKLSDYLHQLLSNRSQAHFVSVPALQLLNAALDKLEEETDQPQTMAILDEVIRERWLD